jgi:site-specific DNA-methyltransferase (cytosine-N4-specific)
MPEALVEPCILAGSRPGDTIFDPFTGSGTVAVVALNHGRNYIGTELNPQYANIAQNRITESGGGLFTEIVLR